MSAGVDVLGLFDAYIAHGIPQERPELQAARAAVAELIEALTAERAIRNAECKPPIDVELAAYARTNAALAKVSP